MYDKKKHDLMRHEMTLGEQMAVLAAIESGRVPAPMSRNAWDARRNVQIDTRAQRVLRHISATPISRSDIVELTGLDGEHVRNALQRLFIDEKIKRADGITDRGGRALWVRA